MMNKIKFEFLQCDYSLLLRSLEDAVYKNLSEGEYSVVADIACLLTNIQTAVREQREAEKG